ncbi:MAG: type II and III secretion system protein [Acidobacteria bacterium]|nr:MAG: type II and III secretion system protein [Acidobacteriota bacterium]
MNPVALLHALQAQVVRPPTAAAPPAADRPEALAYFRAPLLPPPPEEPEASAAEAFPAPTAMGIPVDLNLTTHHSLLVNSPIALKRVSITDTSVAQAVVVSPHQVLIQGRAPGEVSLLLWDADANARAYTIRVQLDPRPLQAELRRLFPASPVSVSASGDALVVSGTLPNAATAKRVLTVAGGFTPHVVNDLNVYQPSDPGQILLQVRFAEIDRSAVSQFGADLLSTGAGNTVGTIGTGQFGGATSVTAPAGSGSQSQSQSGGSSLTGKDAKIGLTDLLNVFLFRRDANLGVTLQALEQRNLLQILAEPNLVAMDGKEASFLAGGEFPFPVVQGQGAINNVTIQFKPFGVNLHFKPTILPDGTIDLQVSPEVSALDFSNALTVSGFLIPALSTRRASTELELRDGQSFVIAGLMDNRLTRNVSKIPGLGDIPILGKFFTSHNDNKTRTELMVVVTAHLVHASNTPPKPLKMVEPFLNPQKYDRNGGGL